MYDNTISVEVYPLEIGLLIRCANAHSNCWEDCIMRKQVAATKENRRNLRQRLMAALAMLLVALILAVGTTFTWLTMSVAPEVTGIVTYVGANGSLEIALLNQDTYGDPNSVKTPSIGESLAASSPEANERWGNLINLEDASYGLSNIVLYPARLNAVLTPDGKGYQIGDKFLSVPTYGYDGRIVDLRDNTMTGKFNGTDFVYNSAALHYGVRGIGSTNSMSAQASYLSDAKMKISGYTKSAQSSAIGSLSGLKDLMMKIAVGNSTFTNDDVAILKKMLSSLQDSEDYIESTLRQGLVAIAASALENETVFEGIRAQITDETKTITVILSDLDIPVPSQFSAWVSAQEQMQSNLSAAIGICDTLTDNAHTKDEFRSALDYIMKLEDVYLGDNTSGKPILQAGAADVANLPLTVTLGPRSGVYATIADFTGNYNADVGTIAKVKTASAQRPAYLTMMSMVVEDLTPAGGGVTTGPITLNDTYGYALDMAFRCNAYGSELLLQTDASQRVYQDSSSAATMGGGSYMEFTTDGSSAMQVARYIDAVRVAFIDNQGNILGVAKLNTSNYETTADGSVRAPLYLYEFSIVASGDDKGKMVMGERLKDSNVITALDQNIAKSITTIVWMDGDIVDNTMVSGGSHISGLLNLQFASSVDLIPLDDSGLKNYVVDKTALKQAVEASKRTYDAGQGNYTTESWRSFTAAYEYADAISTDLAAKPMQVDRAGKKLKAAEEGLKGVALQALQDKVAEVRAKTGKTAIVGAYLAKDGTIVLLDDGEDTVPGDAKARVYRVDYNNNLHDEGNGYVTRIYDEESWLALADALYTAECIAANSPSGEVIDRAILDLDNAFKALNRAVYYQPYDYEGELYYLAISNVADTYGKWYDSDFQRVVVDLAVMNLDAYATPISLVNVSGDYLPKGVTGTTMNLVLMSDVYGSLAEQTIVANNWVLPDGFNFVGGFVGAMEPNPPATVLNVKADMFNVNELYTTPFEMLNISIGSVDDGNHVIRGTLLTDKGVLFDCEKVVNVFTKSSGVAIDGDTALTVSVQDTGVLAAELIGGSEMISSAKWYLVSGNAQTVSINEYTGSWMALAAGEVQIKVEVETAQGNTYTSNPITITVE